MKLVVKQCYQTGQIQQLRTKKNKNAKIEQFEGFYFSYYKIELDIEELAKWMIYSIGMSILFEIKYLVSFSSSNFRLWLS